MPPPPEFLDAYAVEEWNRIAPELHRLGLLTVLDVAPLAAYCQSFAMWRTAGEAFNAAGEDKENPLLTSVYRAADKLLKHGIRFGLTPAARARIVYQGPRGGRFGDLLGG